MSNTLHEQVVLNGVRYFRDSVGYRTALEDETMKLRATLAERADALAEAVADQQTLADDVKRLQGMVAQLDKTEDKQLIYPGRVLYYRNYGQVIEFTAGGGDIKPGVFSTREAAEAKAVRLRQGGK